jgi:arachidonate 15-lipoxygenase
MASAPKLPHDDNATAQRARNLAENQATYGISFDIVEGLPMLASVPSEANFSARYVAGRFVHTADLAANLLAIKARSFFDPMDTLQDYEDFFPVLPKPTTLKNWRTDEGFAEQRLSGANPVSIRRVGSQADMPPELAVTDAHVAAVLGEGTTLAGLADSGSLFVADHREVLAGIGGGSYHGLRRYAAQPMALFSWRRAGLKGWGDLQPLAVQLQDREGSPLVVTPRSEADDWLVAKTVFQMADANVHEMSTHLGRTHFAMEPFGLATARQLADNHPLKVLLEPHLRFLMANNNLGVEFLVNRGGPVDRLLMGTLDESLAVSVKAAQTWSVKANAFPVDMAARGMSGTDAIRHYPYRDDGALLWDALASYVRDYLAIYYQSDAEVAADTELKAWAGELAGTCKVKDMPATLGTLDELAAVVTNVVFTSSATHSAVNYGQYDNMAFCPNMPLAVYRDFHAALSGTQSGGTDGLLLGMLPPQRQAVDQLKIIEELTTYRFDALGHYETPFTDPRAEAVRSTLLQTLALHERRIDVRNQKRIVPYTVLKPSLVLNSISI